MDLKETEKILEQSAKDIKMRDFSEVWQNIKGEIEVEQKQRKKLWAKRYFPAILAACLVLVFAIALPIYLHNIPKAPEEIYFQDSLISIEVNETTFFEELAKDKVSHVSFSNYKTSGCTLYKTEEGKTKGGFVDLYDNLTSPTEMLKIHFYDKSVQIEDESEKVYDLSYSKDNLSVLYKVKSSYPEYNVYVYDINASYNKVNYLIEYTGNAADPIVFFESFFK